MEKRRQKDAIGSFLGFVLLYEKVWDKNKFIDDMKKIWNLELNDEKDDPSTLIAKVGFTKIVAAYMDIPVPYDQTCTSKRECVFESYIDEAKNHSSQLIIYIDGKDDIIKKSIIFTKAVHCALSDPNSICVYTDSAIRKKQTYMKTAEKYLKNDQFPVLNLVWIGKSEKGLCTKGMHKFAKKEIEIYKKDTDIYQLKDSLVKIIENIILDDVKIVSFGDGKFESVIYKKGEILSIDLNGEWICFDI